MSKKTLVSAITAALVVGAASTTFAAANPFSDVPADIAGLMMLFLHLLLMVLSMVIQMVLTRVKTL